MLNIEVLGHWVKPIFTVLPRGGGFIFNTETLCKFVNMPWVPNISHLTSIINHTSHFLYSKVFGIFSYIYQFIKDWGAGYIWETLNAF